MSEQINYAARVLAANAMSASVQFMTQRQYLGGLTPKVMNSLDVKKSLDFEFGGIHWIKITQIGRQMSSPMHQYFSTMQKILFSCHDPHRKQLLFLIYGNGKSVDLYLGIRLFGNNQDSEFAGQLSSFIKASWQGAYASHIELAEEKPTDFLRDEELRKVYTLTGIPSFMKKDGEENLTSIDTLLGTLADQKFAYVVISDPIDENTINSIINQCNEMAGQLESVKSFNFTEGTNYSQTITETLTQTITETDTEGSSTTKRSRLGSVAALGLQLAALLAFGPAVCALQGAASTMAAMGFMSFNSAIGGFVPQHSENKSHSKSIANSKSRSTGYTEGQSQSLATTIVNRHVEYVLKRLNAQLERFDEGLGSGMWNTGVYLMTSNDNIAKSAALQLKAVVSGKNSNLEPIRIHDVTNLFQKGEGKNDFHKALVNYAMPIVPISFTDESGETQILTNPFENGETHLSTMITTEELSCLINFPQRSVPGISVIDSTPDFSLRPSEADENNAIKIGNLLYSCAETNLAITIPTSTLTRHTLITGVNGSGKTNTVLNVLQEAANRSVPFMIIEPAKTEYIDWAIAFNKQLQKDQENHLRLDEKPIKIFIPGRKIYKWHTPDGNIEDYLTSEFRFNPFEVIGKGPSAILAHLDRIKASFGSAFPMQEILPVVMETLLYHIYEPCLKNPYKEAPYPQMLHLRACLSGVIDSLGYEQRNRDNIKAAMTVRINSLLNGWKRELFDNERLMGMSWDELFGGRSVINLSAMGDDTDRSFVMSLLLQFLYEYRINESEKADFTFNSNELKHLIVIEEAHRVMSHNPNPDSPQAKCGQLFSNMLSEIRAYGQGMVIVDQVPGRLIPDAVKNTNLKIIHRLIASDDIDAVSSSMGLTNDQRTIIPKLATGQAIVSGVNAGRASNISDSDVYWCKILKK